MGLNVCWSLSLLFRIQDVGMDGDPDVYLCFSRAGVFLPLPECFLSRRGEKQK
jgi:hypothetical protein